MTNYVMVVIDDLRTCKDEQVLKDAGTDLHYARNSEDGIKLIKDLLGTGTGIDEIWLDHDLGYDDNAKYGFDTIMPVVAFLEELGVDGKSDQIGSIFIHTSNVAMVPAMKAALSPHYTTIPVDAEDFFDVDWG